MKTTVMGNEIDFPIGVAPTGLQKMAHPEGEVATAKGTVMSDFHRSAWYVMAIYFIHSCLDNEDLLGAKLPVP